MAQFIKTSQSTMSGIKYLGTVKVLLSIGQCLAELCDDVVLKPKADNKKDTTWLAQFTFETLREFGGLSRSLTILAWGFLFHDPNGAELCSQPRERIDYLEDGRLELSNNWAERSINPFVIGRKNFLFANTPLGAQGSAVIYSLIETTNETGLDSCRYLTWVLKTAPALGQTLSGWRTAPNQCPCGLPPAITLINFGCDAETLQYRGLVAPGGFDAYLKSLPVLYGGSIKA